jgi:hypothetical protein
MTPRRRIIIVTLSVLSGTVLSYFLFRFRRGGELTTQDTHFLFTNMFFSLLIMFIWKKKKDL